MIFNNYEISHTKIENNVISFIGMQRKTPYFSFYLKKCAEIQNMNTQRCYKNRDATTAEYATNKIRQHHIRYCVFPTS